MPCDSVKAPTDSDGPTGSWISSKRPRYLVPSIFTLLPEEGGGPGPCSLSVDASRRLPAKRRTSRSVSPPTDSTKVDGFVTDTASAPNFLPRLFVGRARAGAIGG